MEIKCKSIEDLILKIGDFYNLNPGAEFFPADDPFHQCFGYACCDPPVWWTFPRNFLFEGGKYVPFFANSQKRIEFLENFINYRETR